jgi:hypothetical protein
MGRRNGIHYHVITNVPGYLPEDDDPLVTWDRRRAEGYAAELKREALEDNWQLEGEPDAPHITAIGSAKSGHIYVSDDNNPYDLGRVIEVIPCSSTTDDCVCQEDRP